MGRAGGESVAPAVVWLATAIVILLAACSGGSPQAEELLLRSGDFPGLAMTETDIQTSESSQGQPSAQVDLSGPNFMLSQSLLMFESQQEARSVLEGIKQNQLAQGIEATNTGKFQDSSGILSELRGGQESHTLFFVEGRALVRITISGPSTLDLLTQYADKAREKAERQ